MLVTENQIRRRRMHTYTLWDGEMDVMVIMSAGVYGFRSAAIIVTRCDDPLEVVSRDWYTDEAREAGKPISDVTTWVAEQLTRLSTGTCGNEGGWGNVQGLR